MAKKTNEKEVREPVELRKYEVFMDNRLQEYIAEYQVNGNKLGIEVAARLMKSFRIFIEQTVRRIAYRQKWTWAQPNVKVTRAKPAKKGAKK